MPKLELVISPRERDLGGFQVRRILPYASHRMVGPFIFLDHMGPAEFAPGKGMDVRPHPHINLATVTYLFEGAIMHRDSLGSEQRIEPGAINWMTAGSGIVHSERTPQELRTEGTKLHGLQCWVALPQASEEMAPTFVHHPAKTLPVFREGSAEIKLLVGSLFGKKSPVKTESDVLYADMSLPAAAAIEIPGEERELAVYLLEGDLSVNGENLPAGSLAVARRGDGLKIQAQNFSRAMILGGRPLEGTRHIFWNFVSSSPERIERAKQDWRERAFPPIPGDDREFIPLPE
jgi:redox-sensitive bicupin YhaK (pirin superfamily)